MSKASRRGAPLTFEQRVKRRLSVLGHSLYLDLNRDHRRTVFLTGSGRSGTTWVGTIANFDHHYRMLVEPFHRGNVPATRTFARRQYLRESNTDQRYLSPATSIFTGAIRDPFVDALTPPGIYSTRIVKDVRSTLMLGWVRARFPGMPIIMLLRHPCAVAWSRTQLGWEDIREDYLGQPELVEDHLAPFAGAIRAARSDFERHVFDWCVENYVPFRTCARGQVHLAFYENFCVNPGAELERLFSFLGRGYDRRVVAKLETPVVSAHQVGRRPDDEADAESVLASWRDRVASDQVERAYDIVASFGLDPIYGRALMPDMARAEAAFTGTSAAPVRAPA